MLRKIFTTICISILFSILSFAQTNDFAIREVATDLYIPWEMTNAPDGSIWFTQRHGSISRLDPVTGQLKQLHLEPEAVTQNEGGMLGLALHPNFPTTPDVYCTYNYNSGVNYKQKLVIYTYNSTTDTLVFKSKIYDDLTSAGIHNGSRLLISNNKLFVTTGDAANQNLPQDQSSWNGKILRFNLDGSIPSDNPISGSPIWSWGHRNPQGLTMVGNKLVSSEHGPSTDDEINIIEKGRNYGWPDVHGYCNTASEITFCNANNVYEPAIAWTPTLAVCGIDYYTNGLFPQWQNKVLMTTLKNQALYVLSFNANQDSVVSQIDIPEVDFGRLRDVLAATDGKIYISTSNSGSVSNKVDKIYEIYDPTPTYNPEHTTIVSGWLVLPNPVTDMMEVIGNDRNPARMVLLDITGRTVLIKKLMTTRTLVDVSMLASGVYMMYILEDGNTPYLIKIQKL